MRFRRVPDSRQGPGGSGQKSDEIQRVLVHIADEVREGFGADQKPSKIFQAVGGNT